MAAAPPVYASATGARGRVASRVAHDARRARFDRLFPLTGVRPGMRVIDLGCGPLGLRAFLGTEVGVTGVDLRPRPEYPGPFVAADVLAGLPFADGEFDLAYCSSVIEHVAVEDRPRFAAELRRVARGWYVQTPAFSFPIEPHALLPGVHWLPQGLRRRCWTLGVAATWEAIDLLRRRELEALFGPALAELSGPLVKSWVSIRPVTPAPG